MSSNLNNPYYISPIDFRIPLQAPAEMDAASRRALEEIYQTLNIMARTFVNYAGIGPQVYKAAYAGNPVTLLNKNLNRFYAEALETINYSQIVSVQNTSGYAGMKLANATDNTRLAIGYCNEPTGLVAGQIGEFILNTGIASFSGLTIGAPYWLSTTAGSISNVPATAAGNVEQFIGIALTPSLLSMNVSSFIQH